MIMQIASCRDRGRGEPKKQTILIILLYTEGVADILFFFEKGQQLCHSLRNGGVQTTEISPTPGLATK
jgi:hypothetical protein